MEESELTYLKNENLRLNKIINILIDQNDTLKYKIAYLEKGEASAEVFSPYLKKEIGSEELCSGWPKNVSGKKEQFLAQPKNEIGNKEVFLASHETEIGKEELFSAMPEKETGWEELKSGGLESVGSKEQALKPFPYFIPLIPENIQKVQDSMGAGFWFRVKREARWAMSKILIQAYNKQGCSYAELGKLTTRSAGGMAKLIASLKKRGLVTRSGKSSFRLTELALNNIRKADCNLQPTDFKP